MSYLSLLMSRQGKSAYINELGKCDGWLFY